MKQRIITVTGRSGSGKTTLIEKLIVHYRSLGMTVSVVKSMRHHFDTEPQGKDTSRYRDSGASASIITNGKMFALVSGLDGGESPLDLAAKFFSGYDIVIIEGFKEGRTAKIEVIGGSSEAPLFHNDADIKIVVTDKPVETVLPVYKRNDIDGIAAEIERQFR